MRARVTRRTYDHSQPLRCLPLLDHTGAAFVKAGVPHVVAVKRSERIQDRAACIFAEAFYFALLRGAKTVRQAFDIGRSAVASAVGIHEASAEAAKVMPLRCFETCKNLAAIAHRDVRFASQFVLLPQSGDHDRCLAQQVLASKRGMPFVDATTPEPNSNLPAFFPLQFFGRHVEWHALLSNLLHRHKRLSTILGSPGMGKSYVCSS